MLEFQGISFIVTQEPLYPVSTQELLVVEEKLQVLFPEDYRTFITTFGSGTFLDLPLRVFSPHDIVENLLSEVRERLAMYWFWRDNPESLTQTLAVECIPCFDSYDGDDILFHPSNRNRLFVLPHGDEEIYTFESFKDLCNWYINRYASLQPPFHFSPHQTLINLEEI
ncbi:MAG: SMI1/KNR4 family protein [Nostoc sp. ChiSLP02]|nr:SMI1/KNR4 family protein [Nostoc sp. DedSLP05]MDZ8101967.1 SMI1/KNR4 family protein [Nostoc sp. DedSLP01]MDZ8185066.1 SMI1/KNR4 family protein [Nostoc sp. ChiSLP02]